MHAYDVGSPKDRSSDCGGSRPIALTGRHRAAKRLGEKRLSRGADEQGATELFKRAQAGQDLVALHGFLRKPEPGIDETDLTTVLARASVALDSGGGPGFLFFQNEKLRPYRDASRLRPSPETALYQDSVTRVFQGLLLFFVLSCDTLIHYRIKLVFERLAATSTEGSR